MLLDIKEEVHNVAILHNILLTLNTHLARRPYSRLSLIIHIILILNDFRTNKTALKVRMYHTGSLRSLVALSYSPGPAFI